MINYKNFIDSGKPFFNHYMLNLTIPIGNLGVSASQNISFTNGIKHLLVTGFTVAVSPVYPIAGGYRFGSWLVDFNFIKSIQLSSILSLNDWTYPLLVNQNLPSKSVDCEYIFENVAGENQFQINCTGYISAADAAIVDLNTHLIVKGFYLV